MMKYTALALVLSTLMGCAATQSGSETKAGNFVLAGPASADGDTVSMRWRYGMALSFDVNEIEKVDFACSPINGAKFSKAGSELKVLKNGVVLAEGPVLEVSVQSTPWLYAEYTTNAICTANMILIDGTEASLVAPVNFTAAVKKTTLQQFALTHQVNKG
ncbi:hypothetical protein [Corallincola spongiicola]|uniref:Lipocalin-like domain-containing protein n=1 Tax=Corallincola spongiicola TaxID=2520508 RepID=A0ABY1WM71_9GAMM|nr:hypothetical protein [Corallincola spongiicola]TAA42568.1 hypothetical protein EXY25_14850 [Corallincola spongiicola]